MVAAMTWREELHRRDEFGRFAFKGLGGVLDRMAAQAEAHHYARQIAEYERLREEHGALYSRYINDRGNAALERETEQAAERVNTVFRALPAAYRRFGMVPHDDGFWYPSRERLGSIDPKVPSDATRPEGNKWMDVAPHHTTTPHDAQGRRVPRPAVLGYTRMGDYPRYDPQARFEFHGPGGQHPAVGGMWLPPGRQTYPGGVPNLLSDEGYAIGEVSMREILGVPDARSREHRNRAGRFSRAEMRAERIQAHHFDEATGVTRGPSADVFGGFLTSPVNPVGRRRTARVKLQRKRTTVAQRPSERAARVQTSLFD